MSLLLERFVHQSTVRAKGTDGKYIEILLRKSRSTNWKKGE